MKILCHVGPWCIEQYTAIAHFIDPNSDIVLMSHFLEIDETKMAKEYYENLKSEIDINNTINPDDFIKRCRVLRSLTKDEALLHLFSMKKAISDALDRERPDIVISEVVDQYLIDLLRFECKQRGVPFFGLVVSFLNGYFRITSRGERGESRSVSQTEVEQVIKKMEGDNYIPKFVLKSSNNSGSYRLILKRVVSNWIRIPYFFFKRNLSKQRYNYHYWASQISAINNFHILPSFWLGEKNWRDDIGNYNKITIYHPLQMYPEATIEYWCECLGDIEYDKKLISIIHSMKESFHFLIKEHPNVIGVRGLGLYKALSSLENVTLVPTNTNSNDIVEMSDSVLVWTGSVGFEAALRGKPVLTICDPYYSIGNKFKKINESTPNEEIITFIKNNSEHLTQEDKYNLVSNLLSGLRPGHYVNDASWDGSNMNDVQDAKQIGAHIRECMCHI